NKVNSISIFYPDIDTYVQIMHNDSKSSFVFIIHAVTNLLHFHEDFTVSKWGSSKVSVKMPTEDESVTTTPKFKQRKVSAVWDFLPGCRRGATTDLGLNKQISVDQGKYSLSI
ncbi:hypothetical protein J1N35_018873, partial [Gossypium stocksii]